MNRFKLLVAGVVVAAVVLSTSVAFAKPLSEQQWRKQANVFCKQNNKEMNALSSVAFAGLGPNDQPTAEQLAAFTEQAVPAIEQTIASIDALNEPKALKKDVKKLVVLGYDAVAGMRTNPGPENDAQFAKVNKIGKRLGLVCGQ
ncbi:MAG: hypothetical protein MUP97_15860 [Acidimicrobiia bacterium]|nr:hypothetical protein [Acidimicrobiia bacterium]